VHFGINDLGHPERPVRRAGYSLSNTLTTRFGAVIRQASVTKAKNS